MLDNEAPTSRAVVLALSISSIVTSMVFGIVAFYFGVVCVQAMPPIRGAFVGKLHRRNSKPFSVSYDNRPNRRWRLAVS